MATFRGVRVPKEGNNLGEMGHVLVCLGEWQWLPLQEGTFPMSLESVVTVLLPLEVAVLCNYMFGNALAARSIKKCSTCFSYSL